MLVYLITFLSCVLHLLYCFCFFDCISVQIIILNNIHYIMVYMYVLIEFFSDFCMNERTEKVCVVHVRFVFFAKVLYSVVQKCFITVICSVMYIRAFPSFSPNQMSELSQSLFCFFQEVVDPACAHKLDLLGPARNTPHVIGSV